MIHVRSRAARRWRRHGAPGSGRAREMEKEVLERFTACREAGSSFY